MSDYNQSYIKFLLSPQWSSLYGEFYKTCEMVGLAKTDLTVC